MKKIIAGIFFVMILSNASAENIFNIYWNFGNLGLGINYSSEHDDNIEFTATIFNLAFEQKNINIGFEYTPIKYWHLFEFKDKPETKGNGGKFSFVNVNIYWDILENRSILLGPCMSINYLYIHTSSGINMQEFIFSSGLRFAYKLKDIKQFKYYNSQIFNTEIGYRNTTGKNKFYFSLNADILLALTGIGRGMEYNQKYTNK